MNTCTVDETKDRVLIKYLNGKSYEYKGWSVDCTVDWKFKVLHLCKWIPSEVGDLEYTKEVFLTDDTLCIESWNSDCVAVWKNPKYKLSVKTDVMTAKQRAKRNQAKKGRTERLIKCYYDVGYAQGYEAGFEEVLAK